MSIEIERKFFLKKIPGGLKLGKSFERYYLFIGKKTEIRLQRKGDECEIERKEINSDLTAHKYPLAISVQEFDELKKPLRKKIVGKAYRLSDSPKTSLKVYEGNHAGLIRIEVNFQSEKEARSFVPPSWFGAELTSSPIGRDSTLIQMNLRRFRRLLSEF